MLALVGVNVDCVASALLVVTVTDPLVPVLPPADVAVNVPVALFPVYFMPSDVRFATPELKSAAPVNLFVPESPDTEPVSGELAAIVTLSADASNNVTALLSAS